MLRNRRCTPVPRPRTRRACRKETARTTCAVCPSDCICPRGPCCRILRRPFSKMVGAYPVRGATLWPPSPPNPTPPPCEALPCLLAALRGLLLYLLTIPCPRRYTQYPRGSALPAFATSFSSPGPRCRSDARICATSGGDHASRSRDSLVGSLYVRGRRLGKHLHWAWPQPIDGPAATFEGEFPPLFRVCVHNNVLHLHPSHPCAVDMVIYNGLFARWLTPSASSLKLFRRQPRLFDDKI